MKKMAMALMLAMLAGVVLTGGCVHAQQRYCPECDFEARLIDGGAAVMITYYLGSSRTVRIPPQIQGLPVTQIGQNAFHSKNIIDISIPSGVTRIGDWAFRYNQLTSVTIPKRCFYP